MHIKGALRIPETSSLYDYSISSRLILIKKLIINGVVQATLFNPVLNVCVFCVSFSAFLSAVSAMLFCSVEIYPIFHLSTFQSRLWSSFFSRPRPLLSSFLLKSIFSPLPLSYRSLCIKRILWSWIGTGMSTSTCTSMCTSMCTSICTAVRSECHKHYTR